MFSFVEEFLRTVFSPLTFLVVLELTVITQTSDELLIEEIHSYVCLCH